MNKRFIIVITLRNGYTIKGYSDYSNATPTRDEYSADIIIKIGGALVRWTDVSNIETIPNPDYKPNED